jgi:hypothetical protein
MTKARQLADLGNAYDDGALSNRNLIINGAMQVAQRGTSFSHNGVVGQFPVDRMNVAIYTSGWSSATGGTSSQVSITDTFNETVNFTKAVRLTPSSDWGRAHWFYKIEGVEFLSAKTVTLSFWARVNTGTLTLSNSNGTGDTRFDQQFGSGGSSIVIQEVNPNITISTSWQKFTITHTFASTNGKTIGTSPYINATILNDVDLSSVGWLEMTGIQLEVGDTATPFEHRSYGEELARCQRYYYAFQITNDPIGKNSFLATAYSANTMYAVIDYPVQMRTEPSLVRGGTWHARNGNNNSFTMSADFQKSGRNNGVLAQGSVGSSNTSDAYWVEPQDGTGYLSFDAEL